MRSVTRMAPPRRLGIGPGVGRLWTASTAGNLGDGVGRVAIALLAARLTRDPVAVAAVTALSYLPWLVFGLPAGVLVDRYDRRRLAALAGAARTAAIAVLTLAAATDRATLWLLYAVVVLLYTCETGYDNAVIAMVPMVVADRDLDRANGRLQGAQLVADSFVGPPLASAAFAVAAGYAFGINVACYAVAAMLLLGLPASGRARPDPAGAAVERLPSMRREIADGLRYLRGHALHRLLLGLMVAVFFGAAMVNAITVLWTLDVLGVSESFYGVFTLTMAVGALAGSQTAAVLARRVGRGRTLWVTVLVAGVGSLVSAATTSPYVAGVGLAMVGWASLAFNIVNVSLRQRLTPSAMLGRVTGAYRAAVTSVMVVGAVAGGAVASVGGLRLPLVIFGLGCLVLGGLAGSRLTNQVVDRAVAEADSDADAADERPG
ncbi:MAG: MFS transporter [Micromonosporaceae bacterium]|nr:MFS transporter [Micromonosporaceae bacterium]